MTDQACILVEFDQGGALTVFKAIAQLIVVDFAWAATEPMQAADVADQAR
ncbi:hypothetical protein LS633_28040 [Pseudomonas sp. NIBR-H-19]|nr:hypothetical protein [Pseudomonas sp. NIBR-H-19]UHC82189.1 hypothetical protein LS633_28040 [Pseudomonas sp. NIBR-H-19]